MDGPSPGLSSSIVPTPERARYDRLRRHGTADREVYSLLPGADQDHRLIPSMPISRAVVGKLSHPGQCLGAWAGVCEEVE
jgi:hypothetical protein